VRRQPPCSRHPVLPPPHGTTLPAVSALPPLLRTAPPTASDVREGDRTASGSIGTGEVSAGGWDLGRRRQRMTEGGRAE
jgi:hypothetical protein